jgi:hypothetical protein
MPSPSDLMGSGNSGLSLSTDYGVGHGVNSYAQSNVSPPPSPDVLPFSTGTKDRPSRAWAFRQLAGLPGTIMNQTSEPAQIPRSDPGVGRQQDGG